MRFRIRSGRQANGFSLIEVVAVLAILLCISAYAVPNFVEGIANIRLRGGMSSLSGMMQNCRMQAIKLNKSMSVHFTVMSAGPVAFIKDATAGSTIANTDPQVQLGAPVTMNQNPTGTDAPTLLDSTILGFDPATNDPTFNARGLPCLYSSGSCATPKGFVYYFTDTRALGKNGWGAVTISPAGHVKTWVWNGTAWGN
jgi:prepilin-type N-terminal cleavage/methylation domain-containing protein